MTRESSAFADGKQYPFSRHVTDISGDGIQCEISYLSQILPQETIRLHSTDDGCCFAWRLSCVLINTSLFLLFAPLSCMCE